MCEKGENEETKLITWYRAEKFKTILSKAHTPPSLGFVKRGLRAQRDNKCNKSR
jgi:hypothetical protein